MIVTCKKEIPARWVFFAVLPWAAFSFNFGVVGVAFLFSLKKFIDNPAGLAFILSLPSFLSLITGPTVGFVSDRVWTRFGRRKPFVIVSWTGVVTALVLMPLMPNFWMLLGAYLLYSISIDFNLALEPLKQEIIPPHERGRATGLMSWFMNLGSIAFYFLALGRFDDVRYMGGFFLSGEKAIYWSSALLFVVMLMLIMLGIKELDQKSALRGQPLSLRGFFRGVLDSELWPIYLLVFSSAALNAGLGPLGNLLYTDQWGYTKQQMGVNVAVGGVINIFIIGLLTLLADRLNRMRAYQTLILASLTINVLYFCYVNFVLPDKHPSLVEIIVFGETGSIIGLLTAMVYVPLVYDYVRRNRMGTYAAGAGMVTRLTNLLTLNGVGLFVWGYATLFQPPAGEMARVALREERSPQELLAELRAAPGGWTRPRDGLPAEGGDLSAATWQANGTFADRGRTWEIRMRDKDAETLSAKRKDLAARQSWLVSTERLLRDKAERGGAAAEKEAGEKRRELEETTAEIAVIDAELARRSALFADQVGRVLGDRLVADGEQVRRAAVGEALLVTFPTAVRPEGESVEALLGALRPDFPGLIDLRPLKTGDGYALTASLAVTPGQAEPDPAALVLAARGKAAPGLLAGEASAPVVVREKTLALEAMTVENPVDPYVSPITRAVNGVLALFHEKPNPRKKLDAIGRTLRSSAGTNHVRIEPGSAPRTLAVTVVVPSGAAGEADDGVSGEALRARFAALLGKGTDVAQAATFYGALEAAAATQKITLVRPVLARDYAPIKYDYMSGYLWMFLLSSIGITMTFVFRHLERKGLIRKRGVEEERAS